MAKYLVNVRRSGCGGGCGLLFGLLILFVIGMTIAIFIVWAVLIALIIAGIVSLVVCIMSYDGEPKNGTILQKIKHLYNTNSQAVIGVVIGAIALIFLLFVIFTGATNRTLSYEQKQAEQQEFVTYSTEATLPYEEYTALCGDYNYDDIIQNSENFRGSKIKTVGKVTSVKNDGNKFQITLSNDNQSFYIKYYRYNDNENSIFTGNQLIVYGELDGIQEYQTTTGGIYMLPILNMVYWQSYN